MRKFTKVISVSVVCALICACLCGLSGCTDAESGDVLTIGYNTCGYGDEYVKQWAEEYNKAHPDEKIEFKIDNAVGSLQSRLETGAELSDIFISLSTNWQSWARNDWLEPLDDLYEMTNEDGKVYGENFRAGYEKYGKLNGVRYVTPHSACSASGFVYSNKLFTDNGWEIPATMDELYALVDKINDLPCNKDSDTSNDIAPFAWGGQTIDYWRDFMLSIWSSVEGREAIETFFKAESPEIYKDRPGLKRGLEVFRELICTGSGVPKNSLPSAMSKNYLRSQNDFVQGRAAMYICLGGIYNETKRVLPADFDMRIFPYPTVAESKKDEDGNPLRYMVVSSEYFDFMCIPKYAKHKELAKKFLLWLSTEKMGGVQLKHSSSISPFNFDESKVEGLDPFIQSSLAVTNGAEYILGISDSPLVEAGKITVFPGVQVFSNMILKNYKPSQCLTESYNYAVQQWDTWKKDIGLE